ncbi:hypothetical protein OSTOST_09270 [Ostertagia ostertagi]
MGPPPPPPPPPLLLSSTTLPSGGWKAAQSQRRNNNSIPAPSDKTRPAVDSAALQHAAARLRKTGYYEQIRGDVRDLSMTSGRIGDERDQRWGTWSQRLELIIGCRCRPCLTEIGRTARSSISWNAIRPENRFMLRPLIPTTLIRSATYVEIPIRATRSSRCYHPASMPYQKIYTRPLITPHLSHLSKTSLNRHCRHRIDPHRLSKLTLPLYVLYSIRHTEMSSTLPLDPTRHPYSMRLNHPMYRRIYRNPIAYAPPHYDSKPYAPRPYSPRSHSAQYSTPQQENSTYNYQTYTKETSRREEQQKTRPSTVQWETPYVRASSPIRDPHARIREFATNTYVEPEPPRSQEYVHTVRRETHTTRNAPNDFATTLRNQGLTASQREANQHQASTLRRDHLPFNADHIYKVRWHTLYDLDLRP